MSIKLKVTYSHRQDEDMDGYIAVRLATLSVTECTDEQIKEVVEGYFPYERCHHDYDCCGNYYARTAKWEPAGRDLNNFIVIRITQSYICNI